jgi:hypothetical protein
MFSHFLLVSSVWIIIAWWQAQNFLNPALFAGFATALDQAGSHLCEWVLTWPGIAPNPAPTLAIYYLLYAFGGPGFSLPMSLFAVALPSLPQR